MDETANHSDQTKFIQYAEESWNETYGGTAKVANAKIRATDKIVSRWASNGKVLDFLVPLLSNNSAAVRYAAAAYFMNYEAREQAILVLRDLIEHESSLISPGAVAVLRAHKISLKP